MKKKRYGNCFVLYGTFRKLLLTMKLSFLIAFLTIVQVSGSVYSQNTRLDLSVENKSMREVFKLIEQESNFRFFYNDEFTDLNKNVNLEINDKKIDDILAMILDNSDVTYRILENNVIVITPISDPLLQPITIKGKITDATTGEPLAGVNIIVEGTVTGATSDANGEYSINVPDSKSVLVFSFVGMTSQRITVGNQQIIDINLQPDLAQLEEVVVVGYGTQRRSDISGSVATVKTEGLISQPTSDLQGMLKGKVAGLYVTLSDARPGGSSDVLLRGIKSLKGGNSPLYVVDGVAISNINEININDVESISVLKDASSQAIYGARASNGVILITTRRGSNTNNKVNVSYQAYYSIQNVVPNFEIFSPEEYIQRRREAYRADLANAGDGWIGTFPPENEMFEPLELERIANKEYINWTDYAFKKDVPLTKHDISLSGGNENTQYSASIGYLYQDGIRTGSDLTRYSGKLSVDQKISKTFKMGLSAYYTTYDQGQETNSWQDFITFNPISVIYDTNGDLVLYPTGDGKSVNPLYYNRTRKYNYKAERIILNGYFEITPAFVPGLKYKLNASMNSRNRETDYFRSFEDPGVIGKGYASANFYYTREYLLENILSYNKLFANVHKLDITLVQGIEPRYNTATTSTATELGNDFFGINSLNSFIAAEVNRTKDERKMVSFMGRANYNLMDKYLFNFAVRIDGSSVFGINNKWGYFPSASFAWNLHKESFIENLKWINEAKIRLSYGQIGNQAISPYGSLATADNYFYVSGSTPVVGYLPGASLPNPDLKWETTTTANGGIDFSLFSNRLSGSIDLYQSNTTDLLVDRKIPEVLGYSNIPANLGEIQNKGIELSLTGYIISKQDFTWSVSASFSANRNKLVKGVLQDPETGEFIDDVYNGWFIGEPVNIYYDHKFLGIWQLDDDIASSAQPLARPGDVRVADMTGDTLINSDDRVIIRRDPKWIGSISTSLTYKGFELSADVYFVQGVVKENPFLYEYNHGGRMDGVLNGIKRDYWTPENPSNTMFRPHESTLSDYRTTLAYQDASYIRLRNVTLSYSFPRKWLVPLGLNNLRVYVSGDNIWTKTDFLSYSPETLANNYPETRNYTFGININF